MEQYSGIAIQGMPSGEGATHDCNHFHLLFIIRPFPSQVDRSIGLNMSPYTGNCSRKVFAVTHLFQMV